MPDIATPTKTHEPYNCEEVCQRNGKWDNNERSFRRCSRSDLVPVSWSDDLGQTMQRMRHHQGRDRLPEYNGEPYPDARGIGIDYRYPPEDPREGCPGGWYRCMYAHSLAPYYRQRTEGGGRVENPEFSRCEDPRVLAAILYLESEQQRAARFCEDTADEYLKQKRGS